MVLSAVGFVKVTVVSLEFELEPSTVKPESLKCKPDIIGLVSVLFTKVLVVTAKYASSRSTSKYFGALELVSYTSKASSLAIPPNEILLAIVEGCATVFISAPEALSPVTLFADPATELT